MLRCKPSKTIEQDHERNVTQAGQALAVPHLCRPFHGQGLQRALPAEPRQGPDRALGRLRSADPDRLRFRPPARARRGRQGGRADLPSRRHAEPVRGHPACRDEHLDDHQRHGRLAARALCRARRGAGRRQGQAHRHGAERHPEGVSLARHLHLPARAVAAADQGRDRLHRARDAEMEPDQCLLLPFAGGGSDAGAGACLRAGHGRGRARRGQRIGRSLGGGFSARGRQHLSSSSMPGCASSPRSPRCAPSSICGTRSPRSATA